MTLTEFLRKYRARFLMSMRRTQFAVTSVFYNGDNRFCPVCEKKSKRFAEHGFPARKDGKCLRCGALDRHRLTWLFFKRQTDLFDEKPKKMLDVAPVPYYEKKLRRRLNEGYVTADIQNPQAMVKMDITDIQYPNDHFDVVYCSHVLEHVLDDRQAMREFQRVLKPEGWAVFLVPVFVEKTYEDPSITDPEERLEHFGQKDHVRVYGPDFADRLEKAGFEVKVIQPSDFLSESEITEMGITEIAGDIFYGEKK